MQRIARPLAIAAVFVGMFALLVGDWLVVLAMALTTTAMVRVARKTDSKP
jgi:hypothetical protein